MGAEYREHRKEQKQARANAQDEHTEPIEQPDWSPATQFQHGQAEPPPGYADAALPSTAPGHLKQEDHQHCQMTKGVKFPRKRTLIPIMSLSKMTKSF